MPQYGVLVYMPAPGDPRAMTPEYLERINQYPAEAKEAGGKVLGGSYFPGQRGFAFGSVDSAAAIQDDEVRTGPLVESELVPAAFYVLSAPNMEVAVQAARLHPATSVGGVEVRELFAASGD